MKKVAKKMNEITLKQINFTKQFNHLFLKRLFRNIYIIIKDNNKMIFSSIFQS